MKTAPEEKKGSERKVGKSLYWTPRVLSILLICFLAMFSLDVFTPDASAQEMAIGFFMHNIPVFVLIAVLVVSWKREIIGGIVFILAGTAYMALLTVQALNERSEWYMLLWGLIIAGPAFLIGILFLINWRRRKIMPDASRH